MFLTFQIQIVWHLHYNLYMYHGNTTVGVYMSPACSIDVSWCSWGCKEIKCHWRWFRVCSRYICLATAKHINSSSLLSFLFLSFVLHGANVWARCTDSYNTHIERKTAHPQRKKDDALWNRRRKASKWTVKHPSDISLFFSLHPTLLSRPPTHASLPFTSFADGGPLKAVWGVLFFSSSHPLPLSSRCQFRALCITWTPLHTLHSLLYNYSQHEPSQMELASANADHYRKCWRLIWVKSLSSAYVRGQDKQLAEFSHNMVVCDNHFRCDSRKHLRRLLSVYDLAFFYGSFLWCHLCGGSPHIWFQKKWQRWSTCWIQSKYWYKI